MGWESTFGPEIVEREDNQEDVGTWLLAQHPERAMEIVLSMGHDEVTSVRHYAGLPFTKADKDAMLEWTSGWAEAR